jgi:hypothetical protein
MIGPNNTRREPLDRLFSIIERAAEAAERLGAPERSTDDSTDKAAVARVGTVRIGGPILPVGKYVGEK